MVAGGWAIDLHLNKITRIHQDIEIAIPRNEQLKLQSFLKNYAFKYVETGVFYDWEKNKKLNLPIHEIHGNHKENKIEILLNEIEEEIWTFRRKPAIKYPLQDLIIDSKQNIPILCPEIVLLYKCKINKEKDKFDLLNTLPYLSKEKINWLKDAINQTHKNHQWIELIK